MEKQMIDFEVEEVFKGDIRYKSVYETESGYEVYLRTFSYLGERTEERSVKTLEEAVNLVPELAKWVTHD